MKKILIILILITISLGTQAQTLFNATEELDINNVNAGFYAFGNLFWNPDTLERYYEFPKGSGSQSNSSSALWIGGYNQATNNLHIAAQTYRQTGNDYWPGPLDEFNGGGSDSIKAANWAQRWKINLSTIDSFKALNTHTISNTNRTILEWPAKGNMNSKNPLNAQLIVPNRDMAPFIDINNDGIYNALDGDYPNIKGEQMLWWVINDNVGSHTKSNGLPLKIEVHVSAYACRKSGMENTIFVNYKIYNWSGNSYDSTVVGFLSEGDLGYSGDDFIGFDSVYRMGILYNGDNFDESNFGYGYSLTQHAVVLISSPFDTTNYKQPIGSFTYYHNNYSRTGHPQLTNNYYGYLTGTWADGSFFTEGCNPESVLGIPSNYSFPDDPSILNGISEKTCNRGPGDRRFILSSNPFTFQSNSQPLEFTYAFINTDTGSNNNNFNELRRLADSAYKYVNACSGPTFASGVPSFKQSNIQLYPNPAHDYFMIKDIDNSEKTVSLYTISGQLLSTETFNKTELKINTHNYSPGLYFIELVKGDERLVEKLRIE